MNSLICSAIAAATHSFRLLRQSTAGSAGVSTPMNSGNFERIILNGKKSKAEGKPLDGTDVEQPCMKFSDMPDITRTCGERLFPGEITKPTTKKWFIIVISVSIVFMALIRVVTDSLAPGFDDILGQFGEQSVLDLISTLSDDIWRAHSIASRFSELISLLCFYAIALSIRFQKKSPVSP